MGVMGVDRQHLAILGGVAGMAMFDNEFGFMGTSLALSSGRETRLDVSKMSGRIDAVQSLRE
jgi:hypothetical protein